MIRVCTACALSVLGEGGVVSERTFVMIKPDALSRRLIGRVIDRYESKGLKLVGMKLQIVPRELAERQYAEHRGKPFYDDLINFMTSGPSIALVWEGPNAVETVRAMNGATDSAKAEPGTIRGEFGLTAHRNIVHASDSLDTAKWEIDLYFDEADLLSYAMPDESWLGVTV
ncbi:MAG: nucleoside-diphosphate kinase [Candidatus Hydrogenedentota bacterium]